MFQSQSTQKLHDELFLQANGGISKKGRVKESSKDSRYKNTTPSEEVSILNDKVQTLKIKLQQKNIEQENIKRKVDRYE